MHSNNEIIDQTRKWLETVIIEHHFCPFAARELARNSIHYSVCRETRMEKCLEAFALELLHLDQDSGIETTLLIFPVAFTDFDDYLDFLELGTALLEQQGYEGVYQLASFHPDYRFADSPENDAANFTNRSPYPMLHLLREKSIEHALEHYSEPELIPERNIRTARRLGYEKMKALLEACSKPQ